MCHQIQHFVNNSSINFVYKSLGEHWIQSYHTVTWAAFKFKYCRDTAIWNAEPPKIFTLQKVNFWNIGKKRLTYCGLFACTPIYQIVPFQMILSLGIHTSSVFIWIHRNSPNQIPSWLFSFVCTLGLREADCWALTPLRSKRGHAATLTRSPGRALTSAVCLLFLFSIFCWGCKASAIATSSFSLFLPHSICRQHTNEPTRMRRVKDALQSLFLSSYDFYPSSTPPAFLHVSSSTVSHNKVREWNKSIKRYILVRVWVIVV